MSHQLDTPQINSRWPWTRHKAQPDRFGKVAEGIARFIGTPRFLLYMTIFCGVWLAWNSMAPEALQFDPRALNFTLLTLMLSLQASYSAPLILLAQERSANRDRVSFEHDRQRAERNLADTEYLTREIASLRMAVNEVATRDFVRSEFRDLLEDLLAERENSQQGPHCPDCEAAHQNHLASEG